MELTRRRVALTSLAAVASTLAAWIITPNGESTTPANPAPAKPEAQPQSVDTAATPQIARASKPPRIIVRDIGPTVDFELIEGIESWMQMMPALKPCIEDRTKDCNAFGPMMTCSNTDIPGAEVKLRVTAGPEGQEMVINIGDIGEGMDYDVDLDDLNATLTTVCREIRTMLEEQDPTFFCSPEMSDEECGNAMDEKTEKGNRAVQKREAADNLIADLEKLDVRITKRQSPTKFTTHTGYEIEMVGFTYGEPSFHVNEVGRILGNKLTVEEVFDRVTP